jgi:DNA replication and repair protein RecF
VRLEHLSLTDFRSYESVELSLEPGATALVGPNGQGKTNLVEAVGYLATLGSHRVASDTALVRMGAAQAVVRGRVVRDSRAMLVEVEINPGKANRARVNKAAVPRPREVLGIVRTVLFAPEDLALVKGDPSERRRFLDEVLVARAPRLAAARSDYDRVLKQRNALLKTAGLARRSGGPDLRTLDVWDSHLSRAGAELLAARVELVEALRPLVEKAYAAVARTTEQLSPTTLDYVSSLGPDVALEPDRDVLAAALQAALAAARSDELERGVTLGGPPRDELALGINGLPARGYASHGESWSLALALRLASYDLLRADGGEPVLILDDVFAELDADRRERLASLVAPAEQVLITAAVAADVPEELAGARVDGMGGQVRGYVCFIPRLFGGAGGRAPHPAFCGSRPGSSRGGSRSRRSSRPRCRARAPQARVVRDLDVAATRPGRPRTVGRHAQPFARRARLGRAGRGGRRHPTLAGGRGRGVGRALPSGQVRRRGADAGGRVDGVGDPDSAARAAAAPPTRRSCRAGDRATRRGARPGRARLAARAASGPRPRPPRHLRLARAS